MITQLLASQKTTRKNERDNSSLSETPETEEIVEKNTGIFMQSQAPIEFSLLKSWLRDTSRFGYREWLVYE